jgi:hypothetical protein
MSLQYKRSVLPPSHLFIAALFLSSPVFAQAIGLPKIVVIPFTPGIGASENNTSKFTKIVSDELKERSDDFEVVDGVAIKTEKPAAAAAESPNKKTSGPNPLALSSLEDGKKAFDELRFDEALPLLKKGIELSLADCANVDFENLSEMYVKVAASAFRLGEEKEAKTNLFDLARLNPKYELTPGYPPVFQREFDKAKVRAEKQPKGQLIIEGPSGATAFLDGRDLGMVPVTEEGVSAGTHYVKVEGSKSEKFGQAVELKNTARHPFGTCGFESIGHAKNCFRNRRSHAANDYGLHKSFGGRICAGGSCVQKQRFTAHSWNGPVPP